MDGMGSEWVVATGGTNHSHYLRGVIKANVVVAVIFLKIT